MASIRQAAQDVLDEARDGIAWIAVWKDGKGWMTRTYYPDIDRQGNLIFEDYDLESLRTLVEFDPDAILVNGFYWNLGDLDVMDRDSLANALRWQYNMGRAKVAYTLENCAS